MNKQEFDELTIPTQHRRENYNNNTGRKIIIRDVDMVKKYPFKTTPLEPPPLPPSHFKFTDRFCGGNINKVAKIRNNPWYILADKNDNTYGLFLPSDNLKLLTLPELKSLCNRYKIEFDIKITKVEIIEKLMEVFE